MWTSSSNCKTEVVQQDKLDDGGYRHTLVIRCNSVSSFLSRAFRGTFSGFNVSLLLSVARSGEGIGSGGLLSLSSVLRSSSCFLARGRSSNCASSASEFCVSIASLTLSARSVCSGDVCDGKIGSGCEVVSAMLGLDGNGFGESVGVNKGSALGRNVELMSPIPTKKSSEGAYGSDISQTDRDKRTDKE